MQKKTVLFILLCFMSGFIYSQTQTPVYLSQVISNANSKGFYRYLPADYASSIKNYPLIIWVHGAGQVGQGNTTDLPKVLEWGVPKIISQGGFPASFTLGDSSFSFVVISPQFLGWPSGANVDAMLTYIMSNYRIDPDRVYLMGISAGGGAAWEFAGTSITNSNKLAAMIPFCGAFAPTQTLANRIAASNLPVWAFHNTNDGTIPVSYSRNWKNFINNYIPAPNPLVLLTEFPVVSSDPVIAHECWSLATLPTYKPAGLNIYEWLLSYRKRTGTVNLVPFASAGQDQGIVLPANAILDGSASSDQDGLIVTYRWRKTAGPALYSFSDSTIISPVVSNLVKGVYLFELSVTDNSGAISKDSLLVNVYASLPAGAQQRVLIDVGGTSNYGGTITPSPSLNGNVWNNMTDARPGIRVANALTINNQVSGISIEVINRVDGTYSTSSLGIGNGNTAGIVSDYPASATTDHALIHKSALNGKWRIKGLQPDKIYTVKFWGTRTNTTAARSAEIKRTDDNVWKTYNATANTNYNNAAVFNITGKTEMDFDIRTRAGSDFSAINVMDIYYGTDTTVTPPQVNLSPVARAGTDAVLQLPVDSVMLQGCTSSDPENAVLKYKWRKISGSAVYQLPVDTLCTVKVKGLVAGVYLFELTVTDTAGLTGKDSVSITVNTVVTTNWPPQVTPLCNKPYKVVVVGSSTAFGTGSNPFDSSWVNKFRSYLLVQNLQVTVINIAQQSLNSYHVSPTGTVVPPPFSVDTARNITKALSLNPDAIILNLPSNDVAMGIPTNTIHNNYSMIAAAAAAQQVPLWVTTTQPRDGISPAERMLQMELRDWINTTYSSKSVDFWSTLANPDGTINTFYAAGDGVHVNNYGHHVLFTRVVEEKIWDTICNRNNLAPIARAGNDTSNTGAIANVTLNGSASFDPEGTSLSFAWRIVNNSNAVLNYASTATPIFSTTVAGNYLIELKCTDHLGATGFDSINIQFNLPNAAPVANAGTDIFLTYITDSVQLNGSASTDAGGNITKYKWQKLSGAGVTILNDSIVMPWLYNLIEGTYLFILTVTDDSLATATDTVTLFVNAAPVANAGADDSIVLPNNSLSLNAGLSFDIDGSIGSYKWKKITGAGTILLTDSTAIQTNVNFSNAGSYIFELTVTDNFGAMGKDSVHITVNPDPNIAPIAHAGVNQTITLPNNIAALNASASFDADGSISFYKWKKVTGAGTVIISDTLAIITNASFATAGSYIFELIVTDNFGAIAKDSVSITVNTDLNMAPVSNAGTNKNLQLPTNKILLDGRNSYDPEGALLTYNWVLVNGPAASQIISFNMDTTSVTFANAGTYIFRLTVTDIAGLTSADDVTIIVLPVPDITKKIKVNIYGGTNPYSNAQWNNWNLNAGLNSPVFLYEDAGSSTVSASLTASGVIADNGSNYAAAATICPPQVLRYNSANTSIRTLTLSGFNVSKKYNLEFYASRANTGNSTRLQIGIFSDTISTTSNTTDYARFNNIIPDNNGKIIISVRSIGTWNYLAGFIITEQENPPALISSVYKGGTPATFKETDAVPLNILEPADITIYPNPAKGIVYVKIPAVITGEYFVVLTDITGKTVFKKTGKKAAATYLQVIDIKNLQQGKYIIQIIQQQNKLIGSFMKL